MLNRYATVRLEWF